MKRVLWVDDEPSELDKATAAARHSYKFDFASTVATALKKLSASIYDAIVLDVILPVGHLPESSNATEILRRYGDRAGVGLLELLASGALDSPTESFMPSRLPVLICTDYTIELLIQDPILLNSAGVVVLPKLHLHLAPESLPATLDSLFRPSSQREPSERLETTGSSKSQPYREGAQFLHLPALFARLLHDHSHTITTIHRAIHGTIDLLRARLEKRVALSNLDGVANNLRRPAEAIAASLQIVISEALPHSGDRRITPDVGSRLARIEAHLTGHASGTESLELGQARQVTQDLASLIRALRGKVSRKALKDLGRKLEPWEDFIALYDLHNAVLRIQEMGLQAETLGGYFSTPSSSLEDRREWFALEELIADAVHSLLAYAEMRGVQLRCYRIEGTRKSEGVLRCEYRGVRRSLARALRNILQNGIKYSYRISDVEAMPWVDIVTRVSPSEYVIEVESWGVPIEADEIESGLIFREGYQGRHSSDGGRFGSGLGLTDAYRTVSKHGGSLNVKSEPVRQKSSSGERPPNVTTFTIKLPLASQSHLAEGVEPGASP